MRRLLVATLALAASILAWVWFGSASNKDEVVAESGHAPPAAAEAEQGSSALVAPQPKLDRHSTSTPDAADVLGSPVDLQSQPVGTQVAKLRPAADGGSASAQFEIYRALTICERAADQRALLAQLPPADRDPELIKSLERSIKFASAVCGDVNANPLSRDRLSYLARAASSGLTDAQVALFIEGPGVAPSDPSTPLNDPRVAEWSAVAVGHPRRLPTRGMPSR